jgi:DNA replicative helicase MCM subunit Mcm2 (Cdc46/Mcm family)
MVDRWDEEERRHSNSNHNDNDDGRSNGDKGWIPKHKDPPVIDPSKIYSVSEASRLHKGKNITVKGVISGIQPMRKMIKGLSRRCMNCNTEYERIYDKPAFFESFVPVEHISKCTQCNTKDFLGAPEYENVNAVIVELKDHDTFSEIDPLRIIVFGDDEPAYDSTIGLDKHIGETVVLTGDIFTIDISRRRGETKMVAYLYVSSLVKYLSKQELELTAEDVNAIKRFVNHVGSDNVVNKLSDMFATSIIGYNTVKKGLLLCAASTCTDKTAKKIHSILVGDPGLAKSLLLKQAVELVPNSRYESVQFATGKSLTAIVTKEESDTLILRIGPIPQAKGAIAALNEIGRMNHDDQGLLLDTLQEQEFTTNKFGQNFHVDAPTVIIASANPTGGCWKGGYDNNPDDKVDLDKIPMIKPLVDRFDLVFIFKDSRDEDVLTEYVEKKSEMEDRKTPDYITYLAKHIMYAKQRYPRPTFSDEAKVMLNEFYVKIRMSHGSPRIRETIYRIAQNITRLKLKNEVDVGDAKETIDFYNIILQQLDKVVASPANPRDTAYNECFRILRDSSFPIAFEEVIRTACKMDPRISRYIGRNFKLRENKKLRPILDMLEDHSHINIVTMKPVVLQYVQASSINNMGINNGSACDHCDPCDHGVDILVQDFGSKDPAEIVQACLIRGHIGHIGHVAIVNSSIYPAVEEMEGTVTATYSDATIATRRVQYLRLTASQNIISMVLKNT